MAYSADAGSLAATGNTAAVPGKSVNISLSGTWVGTVTLQFYSQGGWVDTGSSWTANTFQVADSATTQQWRLAFTRTSGTLVYDLQAGL